MAGTLSAMPCVRRIARPFVATALAFTACSTSPVMFVRVEEPVLVAQGVAAEAGLVSVTLTARNEQSHTIEFELRLPCGSTIRVYEPQAGSAKAAWDQLNWYNSRPGGCKWLPIPVVMSPGATQQYQASATIADVLGDSLPEGRYEIAGVIAIGAPELRLAEVRVGEVELKR